MNLNLLFKIRKYIKSKLYLIVTGSTNTSLPNPATLTQTRYHLGILVNTLPHMNPNSVKIYIQYIM